MNFTHNIRDRTIHLMAVKAIQEFNNQVVK